MALFDKCEVGMKTCYLHCKIKVMSMRGGRGGGSAGDEDDVNLNSSIIIIYKTLLYF